MKSFIVFCCLVGLAASIPVPQDDQQPPSSDFSPKPGKPQADFSSSSNTASSDFSAAGTGLSPSPVFGDSNRFGSDSPSSSSFGSDSDGAFISSPAGFSSGGSRGGNGFLSSPDVSVDPNDSFQDSVLDHSSGGFGSPFPSSVASGPSFTLPQSGTQSFSSDGSDFVGDSSTFDSEFVPPGTVISGTSSDSIDDGSDSSHEDSDDESGGLFGFGRKK